MTEKVHWYDTKDGRSLADAAFKQAGLEEPKGVALETGTYSNEQIARKFEDSLMLLYFLMQISKLNSSEASKRSVASFALDLNLSKQDTPAEG